MGEWADYFIDRLIDHHMMAGRPQRKRGFQQGAGKDRWRTSSGDVVKMADMSIGHLAAAIRKCEAEGNSGKLADLQKALAAKTTHHFTPIPEIPLDRTK